MNILFFTLILIGLVIYIVVTACRLLYDLIVGYWNFSKDYNAGHNPSGLTGDHPLVISTLNKYSYYKPLSPKGKFKFIKRLIAFLADKKFVGMAGLAITDEMRILISAAAVQVTFGLDRYMLLLFHTIRIYPHDFFSRTAEANLKGGTTPSGTMMLSWKDFQEGFHILNDKLNLGLHEMAHAVLLDMLYGQAGNPQLEREIGNWENSVDGELEKLKQNKPTFLRAYGGTNEQEFFAVSVEHFFEAPEAFQNSLPVVYNSLCKLLNQDPQNRTGDYACKNTTGIFS